jgi:hypothetical protein
LRTVAARPPVAAWARILAGTITAGTFAGRSIVTAGAAGVRTVTTAGPTVRPAIATGPVRIQHVLAIMTAEVEPLIPIADVVL